MSASAQRRSRSNCRPRSRIDTSSLPPELGEEADEYITDGRAEEPSDELSADSDLYDPDLLSIDSEDDIGAEDYEEAEDLDEDEE